MGVKMHVLANAMRLGHNAEKLFLHRSWMTCRCDCRVACATRVLSFLGKMYICPLLVKVSYPRLRSIELQLLQNPVRP